MNPQPQLRNIRLYGPLGVEFGRLHRLAVSTTAEAVRALCVLLPGFEQRMMQSKDKGVGYAVFLGKNNIASKELRMESGLVDIRIAPVVLGCKRGGIFQIILGVVLVVVGTYLTVFTAGFSAALVKIGYSMIIGGVVQLLSPQPKDPKSKDKAENQANYAFNGAVNTQAQGNPVPVGYGKMIVGSSVISGGISSSDMVYIPHSGQAYPVVAGGTGPGGGGGDTGGDPEEPLSGWATIPYKLEHGK